MFLAVGVISARTGPTRQREPSSSSANSSTLAALSVTRQVRSSSSRSSCAISYDHHTHSRAVSGAAHGAGPAGWARPLTFMYPCAAERRRAVGVSPTRRSRRRRTRKRHNATAAKTPAPTASSAKFGGVPVRITRRRPPSGRYPQSDRPRSAAAARPGSCPAVRRAGQERPRCARCWCWPHRYRPRAGRRSPSRAR